MEGDGGNGSLGWGCRELSSTTQALFPCIRRVSNLGFPLMFSLFFDLVDLGPTDLPLSPAMFSALRKEALGSFSYHLDCVASWMPQPDRLTWLRLVMDLSRTSGICLVPKANTPFPAGPYVRFFPHWLISPLLINNFMNRP